MSLPLAVVAAVGAAAAFGTSSAVQFAAAHRASDGSADARGVLRLLKDPLWLSGIVADVVGFALLVVAVANGPVSLVQPLQVLGLLVALPVAHRLGGPPLTKAALRSAVLLMVALGVFLALIGDPGQGRRPPRTGPGTMSIGLVLVGLLLVVVFRRARPALRAAVYGLVAGVWYSAATVLLRVVSLRYETGRAPRPGRGDPRGHLEGLEVFTRPEGFVPLVFLVVLGGGGIFLSQVAFQVGPLTASLPAQTAADPFTAVVLGATLLSEDVPGGVLRVAAYALCLAAVVFAARRLTLPEDDPVGQDAAAA